MLQTWTPQVFERGKLLHLQLEFLLLTVELLCLQSLKGGDRFFTESPRKGRSLRREGGGPGAGRVSAGNFRGGGGGLNMFLGAEIPTKVC